MINGFYSHRAKIKSQGVMYYKVWEGERTLKMKQTDLIKNFDGKKEINKLGEEIIKEKRKTYCGQVTKGSLKRMIDMVHLFCEVVPERWIYNKYQKKRVKHRFSFITLTIPMNERKIEGKEGYKKLLQPFIFWLTKTKNVNTYFWKAELQQPLDFQGKTKQSLGQLHYHILIPNWIDKKEIQNKWNYILNKNGFLYEYFKKSGHFDAPSTRIEKPYKAKNVADYVIKEITKNCISTKDVKNIESLLLLENSEKKVLHIEKIDSLLEIAKNRNQIWRINLLENYLKVLKLKSLLLENELERLNVMQEVANIPLGGKIWGCSQNLQPKKILKIDCEEQKKELETKIEIHKKEIENYLSLYGNSCNIYTGYDVLSWHTSQINFLNKKYNSLFKKEKNYFETDFDETLNNRINYCYKHFEKKGVYNSKTKEYENIGFWNKNKNIWENDFIVFYKLPSGYQEILLDKKHKIIEEGKIKERFYKDEYKEFLNNRVGKIMFETNKPFILSNN